MTGTPATAIHKEQVLQDHLIAQLVTGEGYRQREPAADYDRSLALDKALVLEFVQQTQPLRGYCSDARHRQRATHCGHPEMRSASPHR